MTFALQHLGSALRLAFAMFWQVLWPLSLGFLLSAVVETLVSKRAVSRRARARDGPRSVALATLFGAASSSCSYAAVAVAAACSGRAHLSNAIIFEFASTNMVIELGLVLLILLGWQFVAAEFAGGLVMIVILALVFRLALRPRLGGRAREQAERGWSGGWRGTRAWTCRSPTAPSSVASSPRGRSHRSVSTSSPTCTACGSTSPWASSSRVPSARGCRRRVVQALPHRPRRARPGVGCSIGPLIAVLSFVCSVGNVPLAAILWRGGISFGGAIAFIFADLIILPIVNIHRKYYRRRVSLYLFAVSFVTMALAGLIVGGLFGGLGAVPTNRSVAAFDTTVSWNYDTFLDIAFLVLIAVLGVRFVRTDGVSMLRMMDTPPADGTGHGHGPGGHHPEPGARG